MRGAPYPYERWPAWSRGAAAVASGLARTALHAEGSPAARMIDAAASALGGELHVAAGPARMWGGAELRGALPEPLVAIELAARLDGVDHAVVLELTIELAGLLAARVLGGEGPVVRALGLALDELELGALGYLAARVALASGGVLTVRSLATERDAVLRMLGGDSQNVLAWPLAISAADADGAARVWLTEPTGRAWLAQATEARRVAVPSSLLGLPLQLCAHAATVRLTAGELASLELGDVVVPERTELARGARGYYGAATLHVIGQRRGARARCTLHEDTLSIDAIERGEHAMNDEDNPEALVKDAPLELCVELARFTVRLEDVLGLRVGEVWSTGAAIGERVTLTANGRAIARGELVDVDGEIGVRILEKHG